LKRNVTYWRENERHLIENYDEAAKDNFKGWVCHHRLELTLNGEHALTPQELIRHEMYYNRPYFELIYMRRNEHTKLHHTNKVVKNSTKEKLSASHTGMKYAPRSAEYRAKMSAAKKGNTNTKGKHWSNETRHKIAASKFGKHWYNNGSTTILSDKCPIGFTPGLLYKKRAAS
jgi:hypothetical protein